MEFEQEVLQRLSVIETRLSNGITKRQDDHEHRLRFLEKGYYIGLGILLVISTTVQIILKIYF